MKQVSNYPPSHVPDNEGLPVHYSHRFLEEGKVAIGPIDLYWGSSGKGKFNGLIANVEKPDFAIAHNSIQASHVYKNGDFTYKFTHLPTSVINPETVVVIGAGAMVNLAQLEKEINDWNLSPMRLCIHPNVGVITNDHVALEQLENQYMASTMTGAGAAAAAKLRRKAGVQTISDFPVFKEYIFNTYELINGWLDCGWRGILETAQGVDLSIDHGMVRRGSGGNVLKAYPYTTYRNIDPLSFAGMSGIGKRHIGKIIANVRVNPIRVGDGSNSEVDGNSGVSLDGAYSGDHYDDQKEITWEQLTKQSGSKVPLMEMTSLTKRKRRVFTFSQKQHRHTTMIVQPDVFLLNFVNYIDANSLGARGKMTLVEIREAYPLVFSAVYMIENNQHWAGPRVVFLGTGPDDKDFIEIVRTE